MLRAGHAADPGCVTIQDDWANAFNVVRHEDMLPAVAKHAEAAMPYFSWRYGGHTRLWLQGAPASAGPIMSQSGVLQGEPLAPALFALTALGPMQCTQQAVPEVRILGIHDDMAVQGAPGVAARAYEHLCQEMARIGPQPQPAKCAAYSEDPAAGQAEADVAGVPFKPDGIVIAGSPVGTPNHAVAHARERCERVRAWTQKALRAAPVGAGHIPADAHVLGASPGVPAARRADQQGARGRARQGARALQSCCSCQSRCGRRHSW
jgi:hypothetical protein